GPVPSSCANGRRPMRRSASYLRSNRFAGGHVRFLQHRQPKEIVMTNVVPMSRALRLALLADAAASGVTGALLVAGADFLESLLVLPVALMRGAGMVLTPYVILVIFVATRPALRRLGKSSQPIETKWADLALVGKIAA